MPDARLRKVLLPHRLMHRGRAGSRSARQAQPRTGVAVRGWACAAAEPAAQGRRSTRCAYLRHDLQSTQCKEEERGGTTAEEDEVEDEEAEEEGEEALIDWVQCDSCNKWRQLRSQNQLPKKNERWNCAMQWPSSCDVEQQAWRSRSGGKGGGEWTSRRSCGTESEVEAVAEREAEAGPSPLSGMSLEYLIASGGTLLAPGLYDADW